MSYPRVNQKLFWQNTEAGPEGSPPRLRHQLSRAGEGPHVAAEQGRPRLELSGHSVCGARGRGVRGPARAQPLGPEHGRRQEGRGPARGPFLLDPVAPGQEAAPSSLCRPGSCSCRRGISRGGSTWRSGVTRVGAGASLPASDPSPVRGLPRGRSPSPALRFPSAEQGDRGRRDVQ